MRRDLTEWFSSLSTARRRPASKAARRRRVAAPSLGGGESLERRAMLAVTASLSFGRLFIDLNAGGDEATLTSDGTNYTVAGTGYSATTFALSGVNRIYARGNWSETNTTFTIGKGSDIVNDILVNGAVGTTVIDQAIAPTTGEIDIASPTAISLNANLTTVDAGISLAGPVTLGGTSSDTITVGAGGSGVTFLSTVDGASRLVVNSTAATVFGGAIGGKTALASLQTDAGGETVISAATVTTVGAAGQAYGDAVRIQANATFDAGTGPVMFASTVDGSRYVVTDTIAVGTQPWFIALSKDGSRGYVANEDSNTVSVIDMATRAVVATVPVGSQPFDIQLSPDGLQVWTANRDSSSGSVSAIDTATNTLLGTVATGAFTEFLQFSPDGTRVYASNYFGNSVSVIDVVSRAVISTIPVDKPRQAVFSLDGSTAYVPSLFSSSVAVIDTNPVSGTYNTVIATITVGSEPYFAAFLPDGSRLYVPNYDSDSVSVIDTVPTSINYNTVVATINTGSRSYPQYLTVSADGSRVYVVCDGDYAVSVIDTATNTVVATPTTGNYPVYPALSPDGTTLYVSNISGDTLSVIDTTTNTHVQEVIVGSGPYGVAVAPDSETIYVVNYRANSVSVVEVNPQFTLTVNSTGLTTFGGVVGGVGPLASLTTNAGGTTKIAGGSVRTIGPAGQTYNDAVELTGGVRFRSERVGPITFEQTLDGAYPTEFIAGEGAVLFKGAVGSVTPLAGLKITSAASTTGQSTLSLDGSAVGASLHGLWLGAGVSNVSFPNGGTIKNFTGNGIYAPDEGASPTVRSTFAFGTDGWLVGNFLAPTPTPTEPDWVASGGNPDAFIRTSDLYGWNAFLAPSQFLGNWVADKVTSLSFDLRVQASDAVNYASVVLTNGTISISQFGPYPQPNKTWVSYTLDVTSPTGWFYTNDGETPGAPVSAADFAAVLSNVTALRIDADWDGTTPDPEDLEDLDNVVLLASVPNDNLTFTGLTIEGNGEDGVFLDTATNVVISDATIRNNGGRGVAVTDGEDIVIRFSVIENNASDGVSFTKTTGVIEGNEIYGNGLDGVHVDGEDGFNGLVDVLGNIIRENGDDGVDFRDGYFGYSEFDVDADGRLFSVVGGNTIERNSDDGVTLVNVGGVQVGGRFPSDINFINLNGASGVCASGRQPIDTPLVSNGVWVLGNEIDSNEEYGVCLDGAEDIIVGGGPGYSDYDQYAGPEAANTIRRNGIAGVFAQGYSANAAVINNDISENPVGVMITSAYGYVGAFGGGLTVGGPSFPAFPGEDSLIGDLGNRIFDNGEGIRATGDCDGTLVAGNLIEGNLTGANLSSVRGLTFGYGEDPPVRVPLPIGDFGNTVQNNNEGLRGSGDLTGTIVAGNEFLDNTKVGIALQSAKNLTVGGFFGEDSANLISGSPIGLSASGTMTGTEVINNEFDANTIGIALSKATGMLVASNDIANSLKYGISVTGDNSGTEILDNTVTATGSSPGDGIYLNSARNVEVVGNTVSGSAQAGLYVTGNTSGTVVQGNLFTSNRIGMLLESATNAVIGGLGEDEGNTIIGNSDALSGVFRDGIVARGVCTGSSISGTDITDTATGVWMQSVTGLGVIGSTITDSEYYGLTATGTLTGSSFRDNSIEDSKSVPGPGHAMNLVGAQGLSVLDNTATSNAGAGLFVTGTTTGTVVQGNGLIDNRIGIQVFDATNAVIGGSGVGQGNTIDGRADALNGVFREGVMVQGTQSGTTITGTTITDTSTGVWLLAPATMTGTSISNSEYYGVYASGDLTGSSFVGGTITNTLASPGPGYGISLNGAQNLRIENNDFNGNQVAGLFVTGNTSGTEVYDNDFTDNRIAILLIDAANAEIGGTASGEDNRIVGNGNPPTVYRDGVVASGVFSNSTVQNLSITTTVTGVLLQGAQGLAFTDIRMTKTQWFGLTATGTLTGTTFKNSSIAQTGFGTAVGFGVRLAGAKGLLFEDNSITDSADVGMLATDDCSGTSVLDTTWSNTRNLIDLTSGTLTVTPAAPSP